MATIVHFAGGMIFGGVEQVILTTLERVGRRRWRVLLMHYEDAEIGPLLEGAHAAGVETRGVVRSDSGVAIRVARIARALAAENTAIFHAHLPLPQYCRIPLVAAAVARIPAVVSTIHLFKPFSSRRQTIYQELLNSQIDRYIAVSDDIAGQLRRVLRIPERKIVTIRNGIPLERFVCESGTGQPVRSRNNGGPATVFTSARLHPQKGLALLIEAACLVPEARFLIAGDGPQRAELEVMAARLGVSARVHFLGYRSDVSALLRSCDVFALPSIYEGLPLAALEAMAAQRPIVASDVGGVREAIEHGDSGLLVPPGRPDELARAIRELLSNPSLAQNLAQRAGERVRREFSADLMVDRVTRLYDELAPG